MIIILIAENKHYRDWTGKTYSDMLLHYTNKSKNSIDIIYTDQHVKYNKAWFIDKKPDVIVFLDTDTLRFASRFSHVFELDCKIFASSLDFFYFNDCIKCPWIKRSTGLLHFGHATKLLTSYKQYFPNKIIKSFKGRFINSERYRNYNLEKKYDILIYGTRNVINNIEQHNADKDYKQTWEKHNNQLLSNKYNFYPLRKKIEKILLKHKDRYRTRILTPACIFDASVANEDLSKLINQSWLTLSCCTRADIPMSKYFEIAASYSGILGNIPSDYNDLFTPSDI